MGGSGQTVLLARGTRTLRRCSFDARSERQSGHSLLKTKKRSQKMCGPRWPLVLSQRKASIVIPCLK